MHHEGSMNTKSSCMYASSSSEDEEETGTLTASIPPEKWVEINGVLLYLLRQAQKALRERVGETDSLASYFLRSFENDRIPFKIGGTCYADMHHSAIKRRILGIEYLLNSYDDEERAATEGPGAREMFLQRAANNRHKASVIAHARGCMAGMKHRLAPLQDSIGGFRGNDQASMTAGDRQRNGQHGGVDQQLAALAAMTPELRGAVLTAMTVEQMAALLAVMSVEERAAARVEIEQQGATTRRWKLCG